MPESEFKCIHCGEEKHSPQPCVCPVCGYRMFQMPYDRADMLRREITGFVRHLEITAIHDGDMIFSRQETSGKKRPDEAEESVKVFKAQDDLRFPNFQKIQDFVCAADRTEIFFERLHTAVDEIGKHIHIPYAQEYDVSLEPLKAAQQNADVMLCRALSEFSFQAALPEIDWPEMKLVYAEEPDIQLLPAADQLLSLLPELSEKIRRFIKSNNIFGTVFRTRPKISKWLTTGKCGGEALLRCASEVEKTLKKTYVVDILSDGTDELSEMLRVLWNGVYCLQAPSLLTKTYTYHLDNVTAVGDAVHELLLARIAPHYADVEEALSSGALLDGKSEAELFALYDRMIELDSSGFMGVDRDQLIRFGESEKKLQKLVGLAEIKKSIQKIKAYAIANQGADDLNLHMCFSGNPGTGKTEVARLIAGILHENKILPTDHVVEVDRGGLVGQYMGETAQKTAGMIRAAMGGVLFVDEAYALAPKNGGYDYGQEAIATLIKAMEDYRGKFCVILAGYKSEMMDLLSQNPGFRSRIQFSLDFPNYSREELGQIMEMMLESRRYTISGIARDRILDITDTERKRADFANARALRNILDQVIMCQNLRCAGTGDAEIGIVDVERYINDAKIHLPRSFTGGEVLSGEDELEQLVGLASVKRMVRKIKAYAKKNKQDADFNMHMCFYGNPGTGKTEVARIISRLLYEAGVLEEAKLVETDAYGLLGTCVGETAPKTMRKIEEAMGGVLFVDEAYSLAGTDLPEAGVRSNYGDEALTVLLKEMEDRRGRFCVIFAGYKDEMQKMLPANPGLNSRIQFKLDFSDYTREELGDIALALLKKKGYEITGEALSLVLDISDYERKRPNFANARTVRNILDQVIMNQNLRTEDNDGDHWIVLQDVEDYLEEEAIDLHAPAEGVRTIGFV